MGNEVDILVLIQSIARICMLFGVCVLWTSLFIDLLHFLSVASRYQFISINAQIKRRLLRRRLKTVIQIISFSAKGHPQNAPLLTYIITQMLYGKQIFAEVVSGLRN